MRTRIRDERLAAGLTQAELAQRVGTNQSHISQMERGLKSPSLAMLERLAVALQISPSALFALGNDSRCVVINSPTTRLEYANPPSL